jgi:hypothetical protein
MRRLTPTTFPEPATLTDIFKERKKGAPAEGLIAGLVARFAEHDAAVPAFRNIPVRSAILTDHRDLLHNLYESETATALRIKKTIHDLAQLRCPYCGKPGFPYTLDHFLPRSQFQEFSLYCKNLIPSCFDCNTTKQANIWDDSGNRKYLNTYYDEILDSIFVTVTIQPDTPGGSFATPLFELSFGAAGMTNEQIQTCASHFSLLNISDLLRDQFASFLRILRRHFRPEVEANTLTPQMIRDHLARTEESHTADHGPNCWEALFCRAVANNDSLIDYIHTTPLTPSRPLL